MAANGSSAFRPPASAPHPSTARNPTFLLIPIVIGSMLTIVGAIDPIGLRVILRDMPIALFIILGATGLGLCVLPLLRPRDANLSWRLLLACGLGVGLTSLLVLGFGCAGVMSRAWWIIVLGFGCIVGARQLSIQFRRERILSSPSPSSAWTWLWLLVVPFGALSLLAASFPPGILWPAEGNGYDVLEYHLACPREYFEAGRISHLSHNIYSNFPFNVEMLYLLGMILRGDPVKAAFAAQFINALLGVLAVAAVWLAGREFGRTAGLIAGLLAATCPFVTYLSGLAFVENGMLFFAALALAAMIRAQREAPVASLRWIIAGGLCAGFACGCKYTAVPAVLLPLAMHAAWLSARSRRPRVLIAFLLSAMVTFGPWLLKNAVSTGNPFFPLARSVFHERPNVWNDDGAARWHEGHLLAPEDRPIGPRLSRLWSEVFASPMFGPTMGLALLAGLIQMVFRHSHVPPFKSDLHSVPSTPVVAETALAPPSTLACWLMIAIGILAWTSLTHLVGRFAIVLLAPASIITAAMFNRLRTTKAKWAGVVAILFFAGMNLRATLGFFKEAQVFLICDLRNDDGLAWFATGEWPGQHHVPFLNEKTESGLQILMVGDARRFYLNKKNDYCVVFNRNPFAEAAALFSPSELAEWLANHNYDGVYVDWSEMRRLRGSRYRFWESIDESLFKRMLDEQRLVRVEEFAVEEGRPPYATYFQPARTAAAPAASSTTPVQH